MRGIRGVLRRTGGILALAALSIGAVGAAESDAAFRWAAAGYGASVFADAWTSERGFDAGWRETNPALPEHPTDSRFFAQVIAFDGAVLMYARHLHKTRPKLAKMVLIVGSMVHFAAASHNDRLWDER